MTELIWRPDAFDAVTAIIRDNPAIAPQIAVALVSLTDRLQAMPDTCGESRDVPFRVDSEGPLTICFRPDVSAAIVYVTWVHLHWNPRS